MVGGIATVAEAIAADMRGRLPRQHKRQREGLALLTATMLGVRSANLMDLAASLPRSAERLDMRYQWISRLLGNPLIDADAVMAPHAVTPSPLRERGARGEGDSDDSFPAQLRRAANQFLVPRAIPGEPDVAGQDGAPQES